MAQAGIKLNNRESVITIATALGVSRATVYRLLAEDTAE